MRFSTIALSTAGILMGTSALSDAFTDAIVADFRQNGFQSIEIKSSPNQVKAEGIRGSEKLEVIYDRSTGRILKREVERVGAEEIARSGVEYDDDDEDFEDEDDDENDEHDENDERDDDENDERDNDESDESDEGGSDESGGDNDEDDD